MKMLRLTGILLLGLSIAIAGPEELQAQWDCGGDCCMCGPNKLGGCNPLPFGNLKDDCITSLYWCDYCTGSVSDDATAAIEIADMIEDTAIDGLAAITSAFGDRLLLNLSRGIVVVQGSACDPATLEQLVPVSSGKARTFEELGVRSLETFLRDEDPGGP